MNRKLSKEDTGKLIGTESFITKDIMTKMTFKPEWKSFRSHAHCQNMQSIHNNQTIDHATKMRNLLIAGQVRMYSQVKLED